jgi:hypothetical protein
MTGPQAAPGAATPEIDDDDDDDDLVAGGANLPDDVPNDEVMDEPLVVVGNVVDTDVDALVSGTPMIDDDVDG